MAEIKFTKHTITNTSDGPKVVNGKSVVTLAPGQSAEVELSDAEHSSAKGTEWFDFGEAAAKRAAKAATEGEPEA